MLILRTIFALKINKQLLHILLNIFQRNYFVAIIQQVTKCNNMVKYEIVLMDLQLKKKWQVKIQKIHQVISCIL